MRIVISGDGELAFQLANRLCRDHDLVVIEDDPEEAARFERLDIELVQGVATNPVTLAAAGVSDGTAFIACQFSDELNLISCLSAKRFGDVRTVCFVSKEEYYRTFSQDRRDGPVEIDQVIWPQYMLAEEIARIVLVPQAIDVEVFAGGRILLTEYRLREGSPLLGKPLQRLKLPKGMLVVAFVRGDRIYIPSGRTRLEAGDKVAFMAHRLPLRRFHQQFIEQRRSRSRVLTIIGGGTVGVTLGKLLERERSLSLIVIESSRSRCATLAEELPEALVLNGDGTDLELLEAERINNSNVLVSVTSDDEKNLLCSLLARQMNVPRIITRVNKRRNIRLFEGVGIDVPLNPRLTAINTVLNSLQTTSVPVLASIEGGKATVVELNVPETFQPTRLRHLAGIKGSIIGGIVRRDKAIIPHGDDTVEPGDQLLMFSTEEARESLLRLF